MEQIGFKNFRKFADFPAMDLAPITILVGENNAGKSTVVKGILALSDFLKTDFNALMFDEMDFYIDDTENDPKLKAERIKEQNKLLLNNIKFYFNSSYLAHIGTFKRALYNRADDNTIIFETKSSSVSFRVKVTGDPKDDESVFGSVTGISIGFEMFNTVIDYDFIHDSATVTFHPFIFSQSRHQITKQEEQFYEEFKEPVVINMSISDYWNPERSELIDSLITSTEDAINVTIAPSIDDKSGGQYRGRWERRYREYPIIENIDEKTISFLRTFSELRSRPQESFSANRTFVPFRFIGRVRYSYFLRSFKIEYLYAHAVSQTAFYSAKDTNDYLSRTIHEYASQKTYTYKKKFIIKWMKVFGIGDSFRINSIGGEAHLVYIVNKDGTEVNLADKGMGTIQLMVLLFRLAITLPRNNARGYRRFLTESGYSVREPNRESIVIIEEPEQNLHPMLQSKLADLFFELTTKYGYRFLIETHSEYLVRRSQVIVGENFSAEGRLGRNPFKVYYFPSEGNPYDMVYTTSGLFEKKFGDGFINEAGKLHMAILKNAKNNK